MRFCNISYWLQYLDKLYSVYISLLNGQKIKATLYDPTDIDECQVQQQPCAPDETCRNTPVGYDCIPAGCQRGFVLFNDVCQDVDECEQSLHSCSPHERCQNTNGSFTCEPPRSTLAPTTSEAPKIVCRKGYKVRISAFDEFNYFHYSASKNDYTHWWHKSHSERDSAHHMVHRVSQFSLSPTTELSIALTSTNVLRVQVAETTKGVLTCTETMIARHCAVLAGTSNLKLRRAKMLTSAFWAITIVDRYCTLGVLLLFV